MNTYIVSCGTSLFTNYKRLKGREPEGKDALVDFIEDEGWKDSCAELNTLSFLKPGKDDHIYLLVSDTEDGALCGDAISEYLFREGYVLVFVKKVPGLTKKAATFKSRGLINLVNTVVNLIDSAGAGQVRLVATGGFKAQMAFFSMVGVLFKAPVYYIHEDFEDTIEFPVIPVNFDFYQVESNRKGIDAVLSAETKEEASHAINQLPPALLVLFEESDSGKPYVLSPVGKVVMEACDRYTRYQKIEVVCQDSHHNLFGEGNFRELSDVPDEDFRTLVRMMKRLYPDLREIIMDSFSPAQGSDEPFAELIDEPSSGFVKYALRIPRGKQVIKIPVPKGKEKKAKEMLGLRIYEYSLS